MIVSCPNCDAPQELDLPELDDQGVLLECVQCKNQFHAEKGMEQSTAVHAAKVENLENSEVSGAETLDDEIGDEEIEVNEEDLLSELLGESYNKQDEGEELNLDEVLSLDIDEEASGETLLGQTESEEVQVTPDKEVETVEKGEVNEEIEEESIESFEDEENLEDEIDKLLQENLEDVEDTDDFSELESALLEESPSDEKVLNTVKDEAAFGEKQQENQTESTDMENEINPELGQNDEKIDGATEETSKDLAEQDGLNQDTVVEGEPEEKLEEDYTVSEKKDAGEGESEEDLWDETFAEQEKLKEELEKEEDEEDRDNGEKEDAEESGDESEARAKIGPIPLPRTLFGRVLMGGTLLALAGTTVAVYFGVQTFMPPEIAKYLPFPKKEAGVPGEIPLPSDAESGVQKPLVEEPGGARKSAEIDGERTSSQLGADNQPGQEKPTADESPAKEVKPTSLAADSGRPLKQTEQASQPTPALSDQQSGADKPSELKPPAADDGTTKDVSEALEAALGDDEASTTTTEDVDAPLLDPFVPKATVVEFNTIMPVAYTVKDIRVLSFDVAVELDAPKSASLIREAMPVFEKIMVKTVEDFLARKMKKEKKFYNDILYVREKLLKQLTIAFNKGLKGGTVKKVKFKEFLVQ